MGIHRSSVPAVCVLTLVACVVVRPTAAQSSTVVKDPAGKPVQWTEWIDQRSPAAVLVFSSWAPGSEATLESLAALDRACSDRGLAFVVMVVQEPFEAAQEALGVGNDVSWFHDRHGTLLKEYRVIKVPALVIIDADGTVADRIEATAQAMAAWEPDKERE